MMRFLRVFVAIVLVFGFACEIADAQWLGGTLYKKRAVIGGGYTDGDGNGVTIEGSDGTISTTGAIVADGGFSGGVMSGTFSDGTVGTPGIRWTDDPNTGFYTEGSGYINVSGDGADWGHFRKAGAISYLTVGEDDTTYADIRGYGSATDGASLALYNPGDDDYIDFYAWIADGDLSLSADGTDVFIIDDATLDVDFEAHSLFDIDSLTMSGVFTSTNATIAQTLSVDGEVDTTITNTNAGSDAQVSFLMVTDGGTAKMFRASDAFGFNLDDSLVLQDLGGGDLVFFGAAEVVRFGNGGGMDLKGASTIGDGGVTNYLGISATGDQTFTGSAGFYPRLLVQHDEPAAGTGATQIDTGEFLVWQDIAADLYLVFNIGGAVEKVALG